MWCRVTSAGRGSRTVKISSNYTLLALQQRSNRSRVLGAPPSGETNIRLPVTEYRTLACPAERESRVGEVESMKGAELLYLLPPDTRLPDGKLFKHGSISCRDLLIRKPVQRKQSSLPGRRCGCINGKTQQNQGQHRDQSLQPDTEPHPS